MLKTKLNSGFTLIELIIVIAIIGIMTAFFVNTSTISLEKGRDARRKTDLSSIQSAIETYKADCNTYPTSITFGNNSQLTGDGLTSNCPKSNIYLNSVPQDPQSPANTYVYTSNGTTYQICSTLEVPGSNPTSYSCNSSTTSCGGTCYYQVTNP